MRPGFKKNNIGFSRPARGAVTNGARGERGKGWGVSIFSSSSFLLRLPFRLLFFVFLPFFPLPHSLAFSPMILFQFSIKNEIQVLQVNHKSRNTFIYKDIFLQTAILPLGPMCCNKYSRNSERCVPHVTAPCFGGVSPLTRGPFSLVRTTFRAARGSHGI